MIKIKENSVENPLTIHDTIASISKTPNSNQNKRYLKIPIISLLLQAKRRKIQTWYNLTIKETLGRRTSDLQRFKDDFSTDFSLETEDDILTANRIQMYEMIYPRISALKQCFEGLVEDRTEWGIGHRKRF